MDQIGRVIDTGHIINEIFRQEMRRTHYFNILLVGLSGIGKSTFIRSLYKGMIEPRETDGGPTINEYSTVIEENGVKTRVICAETSNFETHDPELYLEYVESKFKEYFVCQRRQLTSKIEDMRVHCCLYFIPNYGKLRLKEEDIECMRALHKRVNLIPIIAKSDTYIAPQRTKFKENILTDLKRHQIEYFHFSFDERLDEERAQIVKREAAKFPFAVVAVDEPIIQNGRARWIREADLGKLDITDEKYDFQALFNLLIRHCILNLIDSTRVNHYSKFRTELVEQAADDEYRSLRDLGLNDSEIDRIEYDLVLSSRKDKPTREQLKEEWEAELQELRVELKNYEAKSYKAASPQMAQPPPAKIPNRPKPLYEKPSHLRDAYRRF